jgi:multiple sugar transport system permease protein/cellobiose transport system permease protein
MNNKISISKILLAILLILVTLLSIFPIYQVLIMSTYTTNEIYTGIKFIPGHNLLNNIQVILGANILRVYRNSIIVSVFSTLGCCITSSMIGYSVAKFQYKGRNKIISFVLATMMIPSQVAIIGYVVEMRYMHLIGTLAPLIINFLAVPFGAFFMIQFIKEAVPTEIIESARVDGCGEFHIFITLVLPLIVPGLATISILIFLWSWNNYLLPLILISKPDQFTIPLMLSSLQTFVSVNYAAQMCGVAFAIIPLIVIFAIGSRTFIRGLTAGSVKG